MSSRHFGVVSDALLREEIHRAGTIFFIKCRKLIHRVRTRSEAG
ncbi:Uncharacterised protein [Vibrio cholerae]|nr:Uncharacterised protein [Vibrio cholerae]